MLGDVLVYEREIKKIGGFGGFLSTSHAHDYTSGNAGTPPGGNPLAYPKESPNPQRAPCHVHGLGFSALQTGHNQTLLVMWLCVSASLNSRHTAPLKTRQGHSTCTLEPSVSVWYGVYLWGRLLLYILGYVYVA